MSAHKVDKNLMWVGDEKRVILEQWAWVVLNTHYANNLVLKYCITCVTIVVWPDVCAYT